MAIVVTVLALDQAIGFELMTPGQVFGMANTAEQFNGSNSADRDATTEWMKTSAAPRHEVRLCAQGRSLTTVNGWGESEIRTPYDLDAVVEADLVIVPGTARFHEAPDEEVCEALRAAARGNRIASICVGAFTLAAAGLLDGVRATTHWRWTDELARMYPAVDVDPSVLFADTGQILTSAGIASGIDMCLHMIRSDAGAEQAARTARHVVVPAWRGGGQAQFIEHADPGDSDHSLQSTIDWMQQNLASPLDLKSIAQPAGLSVRSLNRQFQLRVGTTPQKLLLRMRADRARQLLETTNLPIDRIAAEAGFGSHASLRHHFVRLVGKPPRAYRSAFRSRPRTG
ncbi:GlxA family transcriptional regulator [Streptomyces sp. NPDC018964]|uniref:GlxA family transcriptional regulator n=1 Tax=unclassified Streptomyces TaxID=2593676 RepID=UPI00379890BC